MLRVTLHINEEQIGDYQIQNVGESSLFGRHRYEVRPIVGDKTGKIITVLLHERESGAEALASDALRAISRLKKKV